ncbi:MAG TPA: fibronectin type III domain-containing protein, partial [Thermoanaerobaculia bacterium]
MKCRVATPRIVLAAVFLSTAAAVVSAALVAPTSLTATAESASQIRLTWADSNTNETGFSVERSLSAASGFAVVGSPSKGTTSWVDTGVSPATTYYYRIQATARKGGSSPYSNVASATTPIPVQIPAAPTGAAAVAASTSQINVSWTDNSSNETGFKVERATSSSGPWGQIGTTAGTTYADSGLAASTTYWYRVRAFNTAGDSGYTNSASATTQGTPTVPIAPSNLSAVGASATQINLTWRDNSSDEAGFKIERAPAAAGPWTNIGLAANSATSYSDSGLAASTTYWYRVRAYNVVGDSGYSNAASATTASSGGGTPGSHLWSRNYGGPSASASVFPFSVAVDVTGEIVMTGYFVNSVDMGTGAMTSAGAGDIFVARYGADGTPLWSKRMGSSGDDRGKAIAVDGSGNVYVTGFFRGTVDFGGGGIAAAPSSTNAFLVKYSATGAHLWSKRLSTALGVDEATSLAVDASGNAVVGGVLYQTSDFGGGALTSAGGADIFLVKVSATGAHLWSRRFGGTLDDWVNSVALDGQGNVAATGYFN